MLMNVSVKFVLREGSVNVNCFFYTILLYSLTGWKVFAMYCIKAYESTFVINLSKYQYLVYKELSACRRELNGLITNTIDNLKYQIEKTFYQV